MAEHTQNIFLMPVQFIFDVYLLCSTRFQLETKSRFAMPKKFLTFANK